MFTGESSEPKTVEEAIKKEIDNIRQNGIDKKLFSAVKCGMYGDAVRRYNSVSEICMNFAESAVFDYDMFEEIRLLKTVTLDDVYKRLDIFDNDLSVLSVIKPLEK